MPTGTDIPAKMIKTRPVIRIICDLVNFIIATKLDTPTTVYQGTRNTLNQTTIYDEIGKL